MRSFYVSYAGPHPKPFTIADLGTTCHRRNEPEALESRETQLDENEVIILIVELFRRLGYSVERDARLGGVRVDLVVESQDGLKSPVEIKARGKLLTTRQVMEVYMHLHSTTFTDGLISPIFIGLPGFTAEAKALGKERSNFRLWGPETLLEKSKPFADLHRQFLKILGEHDSFLKPPAIIDADGLELIQRLEAHITKNTLSPTEYEELCKQVFAYVFDPNLYDFRRQAETSDGANRYDFICRIRSGNQFWDSIKRDFRTRAILFECKNYEEKITADQVYSTERYLFNNALRTVCFLISRLGPNEGCIRAAQGAMREAGKLILLLSNTDLISLIRLTTEHEGAEDYLDEKIWDFVISLPR